MGVIWRVDHVLHLSHSSKTSAAVIGRTLGHVTKRCIFIGSELITAVIGSLLCWSLAVTKYYLSRMSCLIFTDKCEPSRSDLIETLFVNQDIESHNSEYIWNAQNKYYSAKIRIVIKDSLPDLTDDSNDLHAVIYYTDVSDPEDKTVMKRLDDWNRAVCHDVDEQDDERIKLVVFKSLDHFTDSIRTELQLWAVSKGAEIVDLSEDQDDPDSPFQTGNGRVVDALMAYAGWPTPKSPAEEEGVEGQEDPSFEDLFSKLSEFRESAQTMPSDQRKAFAEEIAMAFYSAMGESDSEPDSAENP